MQAILPTVFGCIIVVAVAGVVTVPALLPVVVALAVVLDKVVLVVWPSVMMSYIHDAG